MNLLIRLARVVLLVVPLALCVFGLRFTCDSADLRRLAWEVRRREELLQWRRDTFRFIEAREEVVRELITQQCSLKEALTRLQELDRERSDYIAKFRSCERHQFRGVDPALCLVVFSVRGVAVATRAPGPARPIRPSPASAAGGPTRHGSVTDAAPHLPSAPSHQLKRTRRRQSAIQHTCGTESARVRNNPSTALATRPCATTGGVGRSSLQPA
jgi:hypothetical protein